MDAAAAVVAELEPLADPVRAEGEKRYLKSGFAHLGVPVPRIRRIAVAAARGLAGRDEALALATALWAVERSGEGGPVPLHEARMAAIEVLTARVADLTAADLPVAEGFIRDSSSWAYVDGLADKVVGGLLRACPETARTLDAWVGDRCLWIRRASLLALLPGIRAGRPDLARLDRYGAALADEREFFVRRALGWVLRELAKRDPEWVAAWVRAHLAEVSGVTLREAVKYLPEAEAARLRAAYRAR